MKHVYDIPDVSLREGKKFLALAGATLFIAIAWASHHVYVLLTEAISPENTYNLEFLWVAIFALLAQQLVLGWSERPWTATPSQQCDLDKLRVTVNVPCYNEDPALLDRALYALSRQTRLPNRIQVVDDGSTSSTYDEVRNYWAQQMPDAVEFSWVRTPNRGKRRAQTETFRNDDGDIFITIDSDTALDRRAIEEGLKPFADPTVNSVAGVEVPFNMNANLLTRITGLRQFGWQLISCSGLSRMGAVLCNRGTYALYRAEVIRDNIDAYLNEKFAGRLVEFSDDSFLTLLAACSGRTVQQPTAFQLPVHPDRLNHHIRQWIRWMRGATIRDFWRVRYLRLNNYGWWVTVLNWWQFAMTGIAYALVFVWVPLVTGQSVLSAALIASMFSYLMVLKYLVLRRSDESLMKQLATYALAPVSLVWGQLVLKPVRLYSMVTCLKMGWGTRSKVEVGITEQPADIVRLGPTSPNGAARAA